MKRMSTREKYEEAAVKAILEKIVVPEKIEFIRKYSSGICADIGCGDGQYLPYFNCDDVIAVDLSLTRLKRAVKKRDVFGIVADVKVLPFKDDTFDFIWSSEVIEHLTENDGDKMVDELRRIGRGKIVITTPNTNFFSETIKNIFNRERKKSLKAGKVYHLSLYDPKKLSKLGFHVFGILGDSSIQMSFFKAPIIRKLIGFFIYRCPLFSSDLVGVMDVTSNSIHNIY